MWVMPSPLSDCMIIIDMLYHTVSAKPLFITSYLCFQLVHLFLISRPLRLSAVPDHLFCCCDGANLLVMAVVAEDQSEQYK